LVIEKSLSHFLTRQLLHTKLHNQKLEANGESNCQTSLG